MDVITTAHKLAYQSNVELALQQRRSKFEMSMTYVTGLNGRQKQVLELIGSTTAIVDGNRGGDTPNIDANIEPVWIIPHQIEWGKLIEKEDAIKALTDYESPFVQNGAAAVKRASDELYVKGSNGVGGLFGTRVIGQDGTTTSAWAGDTVAVGIGAGPTDDTTPTGMNVRKLLRALRYLQSRQVEVEFEQVFATVNAQGMEELYRDITFVNQDYRNKAVLEEKQVRSILGIEIIPADGQVALANFDGSTYTFALWVKSGMYIGDFSPLMTRAEPNPAKKYRIHPYMEVWRGSTRSEDYKVVKILSKI
jgi:capsid protein